MLIACRPSALDGFIESATPEAVVQEQARLLKQARAGGSKEDAKTRAGGKRRASDGSGDLRTYGFSKVAEVPTGAFYAKAGCVLPAPSFTYRCSRSARRASAGYVCAALTRRGVLTLLQLVARAHAGPDRLVRPRRRRRGCGRGRAARAPPARRA